MEIALVVVHHPNAQSTLPARIIRSAHAFHIEARRMAFHRDLAHQSRLDQFLRLL